MKRSFALDALTLDRSVAIPVGPAALDAGRHRQAIVVDDWTGIYSGNPEKLIRAEIHARRAARGGWPHSSPPFRTPSMQQVSTPSRSFAL